jgi:hypothetical protein
MKKWHCLLMGLLVIFNYRLIAQEGILKVGPNLNKAFSFIDIKLHDNI